MTPTIVPTTRGGFLLRAIVAATLFAVAAVVLLAVVVRVPPHSPGPEWVEAGSVATIREAGVVFVRQADAYVVANPPIRPIALRARSPQMGEPVRFCRSSGWFEDPMHGSKFDRFGRYALGPAPRGLDRLSVRVVDGIVWLDPSSVTDGPERGAETQPPSGPFCIGSG